MLHSLTPECSSQLPAEILDDYERKRSIFDTANSLVPDPVAQVEKERLIEPWTDEEKRIFMEKFLQYPKVGQRALNYRKCAWTYISGLSSVKITRSAAAIALIHASKPCLCDVCALLPVVVKQPLWRTPQDFHKISTFLTHRSPTDCIRFYYKHQKLDEFAAVRRKQQLKKRRLQTDLNKRNNYMASHAFVVRVEPPPMPKPLESRATDPSARGKGMWASMVHVLVFTSRLTFCDMLAAA